MASDLVGRTPDLAVLSSLLERPPYEYHFASSKRFHLSASYGQNQRRGTYSWCRTDQVAGAR
ncbi:protein of unknown function (plasmid) [Agrobacterium pusense]|uniref:Uncharacterized protein n=1 Tax=Agrobacterium pusense TaxID=648995 RepID=U4QHU6_9HYPH|nr:protein of unknown function [Agrobacterium pusense]